MWDWISKWTETITNNIHHPQTCLSTGLWAVPLLPEWWDTWRQPWTGAPGPMPSGARQQGAWSLSTTESLRSSAMTPLPQTLFWPQPPTSSQLTHPRHPPGLPPGRHWRHLGHHSRQDGVPEDHGRQTQVPPHSGCPPPTLPLPCDSKTVLRICCRLPPASFPQSSRPTMSCWGQSSAASPTSPFRTQIQPGPRLCSLSIMVVSESGVQYSLPPRPFWLLLLAPLVWSPRSYQRSATGPSCSKGRLIDLVVSRTQQSSRHWLSIP